MAEPSRYTLDIDASAELLSVARLFLASVLRHVGAGEDEVADAKLAVSELGTATLLAHPGSRITITAEHAHPEVRIGVSPFGHAPPADGVDPLDVVAALYPEVVLGEERAEFVVRLPE